MRQGVCHSSGCRVNKANKTARQLMSGPLRPPQDSNNSPRDAVERDRANALAAVISAVRRGDAGTDDIALAWKEFRRLTGKLVRDFGHRIADAERDLDQVVLASKRAAVMQAIESEFENRGEAAAHAFIEESLFKMGRERGLSDAECICFAAEGEALIAQLVTFGSRSTARPASRLGCER